MQRVALDGDVEGLARRVGRRAWVWPAIARASSVANRRHYDGRVVPVIDPMGRELHWITAVPIEETEEGTDRWAVRHGFVSITPLVLDLTDHGLLARARQAHPA